MVNWLCCAFIVHTWLHTDRLLSLYKTFELLVGRWLFHPEDGGNEWSLEDDHLAKMLELTGESFVPAILEHAQLRKQYFDDSGMSSCH